MINLFLQIGQSIRISALGLFAAFLKVELDLAECFELGDEIIVENGKVAEWLQLDLFLQLRINLVLRAPN